MRANPLHQPRHGSRRVPLAVLAVLLPGSGFSSCTNVAPREPASVPNDAARPASVHLIHGVRHVVSTEPELLLRPDTVSPDDPAHLLFFQGTPAYTTSSGDTYAADGWDRLLWVDRRLRGQSVPRPRDPATLARLDSAGGLAAWLAAFDSGQQTPEVAAGGFRFVALAGTGVAALAPSGDTAWVSNHETAGAPGHPVTATTTGPDGLLYTLAGGGRPHLDAIGVETGELMAFTELEDTTPTLAADGSGRVYSVDDFVVLTGLAPAQRRELSRFDLARLDGGSVSTTDLADRVTLVNLWASWCAPCREELPALSRLAGSIHDPRFWFLTMNEDVSGTDAVLFADDINFQHPVLLGQGRLKRRFRYFGLPYTALIDGQNRIVMEWSGYGGPQQVQDVHALILAELARAH